MRLVPLSRRRLATLMATCVGLLAGLVGAVGFASPAKAAPLTNFYASSGDRCLYGETKGNIDWNPITLSILPAVAVKGVLVDKPVSYADTLACRDDLMYSVVTISGYTGGRLVASQAAKANNGNADYGFLLSSRGAVIDTVTVQICRISLVPTFAPVDYCGKVATYRRLVITPTV